MPEIHIKYAGDIHPLTALGAVVAIVEQGRVKSLGGYSQYAELNHVRVEGIDELIKVQCNRRRKDTAWDWFDVRYVTEKQENDEL